MTSGWRYRIGSVIGVGVFVTATVALANHPAIETWYRYLPVVGHLPVDRATGWELVFESSVAGVVVLVSLLPLYKPQPRRIVEVWMVALRRTVVALLALATIGYFDYTYRVPRATLVISGSFLLVVIPAWFIIIRGRPTTLGDGRTVIVGDDAREIDRVLDVLDTPVLGYVSLPTSYTESGTDRRQITDGAGVATYREQDTEIEYLGGLSKLEQILVKHDVDMAVFGFSQTDREEFFGALATCHEYGVGAKIHRQKADTVLVDADPGSELVDIAIEPWDWQDRALKRGFDLMFAGIGLLVLSPLLFVIAVVIKLDSPGPVLYAQQRTAEFGETFTVYKFRSMVQNAEAKTGAKLSEADKGGRDPRVTRVGYVLRKTHLDEIPQLWSILVGDMSVVGPRPERPELDSDIEDTVSEWRRRWFVRPGLTGLAQINNVTGHEPELKLRYDLEYIQQQSFWYDIKIVVRQIWQVLIDAKRLLTG
jgi:lipopolysaccharide/colanic/teichoic acid biosynthesis glycosyltransferase